MQVIRSWKLHCELDDDDDDDDDISINNKLSLTTEKNKIYTFTMNAVSTLMIGKNIATTKYDCKKQFA
jgi:hypothetical protein